MQRLLCLILFLIPSLALAVSDTTTIRTELDFVATTTSTRLLPQSSHRNYLLIQNHGSASVFIKLGSAHSGGDIGIEIGAGGNYEPIRVTDNAIFIETLSGTQSVTVISGDTQ